MVEEVESWQARSSWTQVAIEVMIVKEDKVVKNATKETVDVVDLAMVTEDKEIFMEDSKIQDIVGMIFVIT